MHYLIYVIVLHMILRLRRNLADFQGMGQLSLGDVQGLLGHRGQLLELLEMDQLIVTKTFS